MCWFNNNGAVLKKGCGGMKHVSACHSLQLIFAIHIFALVPTQVHVGHQGGGQRPLRRIARRWRPVRSLDHQQVRCLVVCQARTVHAERCSGMSAINLCTMSGTRKKCCDRRNNSVLAMVIYHVCVTVAACVMQV
jgi:hypothetical protein